MKDNFPEAGAVAFTTVKTPEGFTWNVTFRDADGEKIAVRISNFQKFCAKEENNWKPVEPRSFGGTKKEVEYVKDVDGSDFVCPMCKVGHVKIIRSAKGVFYGCDTSKFDPSTKTYTGCKYFSTTSPLPEVFRNADGVTRGTDPI